MLSRRPCPGGCLRRSRPVVPGRQHPGRWRWGTDYLTADTLSGRVFVSRATHVMVLDANSGQVIGDIPNTPRFHGIVLLPGVNRGFTTKGGDSTVAIFDLKTLAPSGRVRVATGGLDGIMYDPTAKRIVLTNHSKPHGTAVAIDPASGSIVAAGALNEGPTGIAYDKRFARVFVGCSDTSVVVDPASGKVVATIPNGAGVDALGWDPVERLIYLPAGRAGNVTVVHQDDADHYRVIATVPTFPGPRPSR